jgi:hypothetical protein
MPYFGSTLLDAFYGPGPIFHDVDYDDMDVWSDSDEDSLWVSVRSASGVAVVCCEDGLLRDALACFQMTVLRHWAGGDYDAWRVEQTGFVVLCRNR